MTAHAISAAARAPRSPDRPRQLCVSRTAASVVLLSSRPHNWSAQGEPRVPPVKRGAGGDGLQVARELSGLDIRILRLVAGGWSNAAIGRYVHHSERGVAKRLARINGVIGARNREHAAALAVLLGQVTARHLPSAPHDRPDLAPADAEVLIAAVDGSTTREIARDPGRTYGQVHHSRVRLAHAFNARAAAETAAAAVLADAVTARMVDRQFPDVPLSALTTAHSREFAS